MNCNLKDKVVLEGKSNDKIVIRLITIKGNLVILICMRCF